MGKRIYSQYNRKHMVHMHLYVEFHKWVQIALMPEGKLHALT